LTPFVAKETRNKIDHSLIYDLCGVINHKGNMRMGHYTCMVRMMNHLDQEEVGKSLRMRIKCYAGSYILFVICFSRVRFYVSIVTCYSWYARHPLRNLWELKLTSFNCVCQTLKNNCPSIIFWSCKRIM